MKKIEKIERATQREEARAGHASGVNEPLEAALAEGATSGLSGAQSRISSAIRRRYLAIAAKTRAEPPLPEHHSGPLALLRKRSGSLRGTYRTSGSPPSESRVGLAAPTM